MHPSLHLLINGLSRYPVLIRAWICKPKCQFSLFTQEGPYRKWICGLHIKVIHLTKAFQHLLSSLSFLQKQWVANIWRVNETMKQKNIHSRYRFLAGDRWSAPVGVDGPRCGQHISVPRQPFSKMLVGAQRKWRNRAYTKSRSHSEEPSAAILLSVGTAEPTPRQHTEKVM